MKLNRKQIIEAAAILLLTVLVAAVTMLAVNWTELFGGAEAETECLRNNVFALRVGTGAIGTDKISAFEITYRDTNGISHVESIDPAGLKNSYDFVKSCTYCGTAQNVGGDSMLRDHGTGTEPLSASDFPAGLEPYTNNVYVFQTLYPLSYVEALAVTGSAADEWSCTELNIYRVKYLYPLREYGWCSAEWFVPFEGTLIAEVPLEAGSGGGKGSIYSFDNETVEFGTGLHRLRVYGVPSSVSSKTDAEGFTYYQAFTEEKPYAVNQDEYAFSVSLADADGAGIESFYNVASDLSMTDLLSDKAWVNKLRSKSGIYMQLSYLDTNGSVHTATLPFTMSAAEWAYYSMSEESRAEPVHGLFQQGEDISFRGVLPDFAEVRDCRILYKDTDSAASVAVSAVSVGKPDSAGAAVTNGMLKVKYPEAACVFFCAPDTEGVYIGSGQSVSVQLREWNTVEKLKPQAKGSRYLVAVRTDEMSGAATANEMSVSFTYSTLDGTDAATESCSLKKAVKDYCGYWLDSGGADADCAYRTAVSAGGEMYFVVNVSNLYKFTSATFTMEESVPDETEEAAGESTGEGYGTGGRDEWQMKSVTVYELSELGERQVISGSAGTSSGVTTNRSYYRDNVYGSRGAISSGSGPLLIAPGQSRTVTLEEGDGSTDKNKAADIKNLSYEDTEQDFGFGSERAKYLIGVQFSDEDADCGSKSRFYLRLVFRDSDGRLRKSPCIPANRQPDSDGSGTGASEELAIYTNDDCGTPVRIDIIPDNTSSIGDESDKLCIDCITVSRTGDTGVSLTWKTDSVGRIDIESRDGGEEQSGRTDEELVRSFKLKESGYKALIEFGIQTSAEYVGDTQFEGQVVADITYRDSSGTVRTKNGVSVVGELAAYAGRSSGVSGAEEGTELSVPSYMFKKGCTNRFLMEFDDISSLVSMKLRVTATEDTSLSIENIFARQVADNGTLSLNIFNEYQHVYSADPVDLAVSDNTKAVIISPQDEVTFTFGSGNCVRVYEDGSSETEEGGAEGKNDAISMTIALRDMNGADTSVPLPARIVYKNIYGDACAAAAKLVYDAATQKYMIPAGSLPKTAYIAIPYQVEITGGALAGRELGEVTVNKVRGGTCLKVYGFTPDEGTRLASESPVTVGIEAAGDYSKQNSYTSETQKVYLQFGSLTQKALLSQSQDIEVAIIYTRRDDPYSYEQDSDYASVMNSGYTVVNSGTVVCVPVQAGSVGAVKGVRIRTTDGTMRVNIEKGCIAIEESSTLSGGRLSTGWVNLPSSTAIVSSEGTPMHSDGKSLTEALTASRISPVSISVGMSRINRSDAMVKTTLFYKDTAGILRSVSKEMNASDWNNTAAWFLTEGIDTPQYYKIDVYDTDSTNIAGVTVSGMDIGWYNRSGVFTTSSYTGSMALTEGVSVTSSLITTQLTGTVSASNGQSARLEDNCINTERTEYGTLTVKGSSTVTISANLPGFAGELEAFVMNEATGTSVTGTISAESASETLTYSFQLPLNTGSAKLRYSFNVQAKNFPRQYSAKVNIDVEPSLCIEGASFRADGTKISDFASYDFFTGDDLYAEGQMNSGTVLTVYARAANDSNGIAFTMDPADGIAFTVTETPGCALAGYTGTFTKYEITVGTSANPQYAAFKVYSITDANVSYALRFITADTAPAPTPEVQPAPAPTPEAEPTPETEPTPEAEATPETEAGQTDGE